MAWHCAAGLCARCAASGGAGWPHAPRAWRPAACTAMRCPAPSHTSPRLTSQRATRYGQPALCAMHHAPYTMHACNALQMRSRRAVQCPGAAIARRLHPRYTSITCKSMECVRAPPVLQQLLGHHLGLNGMNHATQLMLMLLGLRGALNCCAVCWSHPPLAAAGHQPRPAAGAVRHMPRRPV